MSPKKHGTGANFRGGAGFRQSEPFSLHSYGRHFRYSPEEAGVVLHRHDTGNRAEGARDEPDLVEVYYSLQLVVGSVQLNEWERHSHGAPVRGK